MVLLFLFYFGLFALFNVNLSAFAVAMIVLGLITSVSRGGSSASWIPT